MSDRDIGILRLILEKENGFQTEIRAAILSGTDELRETPSDDPAEPDDLRNDIPHPAPEALTDDKEEEEEEESGEENSTLFEDLYWYYERT